MAAGLSLKKENLDEFRRRINANSTLTKEDFVEKIKIDVPMPTYYANMDLVEEFDILAPFGNGNPKPVFMDDCVGISRMWVVGKNQNVLRLTLITKADTKVSGIYFGDIEKFFGYLTERFGVDAVESAKNGQSNNIQIAIVYCPKINIFRDTQNLQFEIRYYK